MAENNEGWAGLDEPAAEDGGNELARAFRRCFASPDGQAVIDTLRDMTIKQALPAQASDAMLRHVEGQRGLVLWIERQIERGMV